MEIDIKSTPSLMASSSAAKMFKSLQPTSQHTLYIAMRADGTPPRAVPLAKPYKLAPAIEAPAMMDEVWLPWPSSSNGDRLRLGMVESSL